MKQNTGNGKAPGHFANRHGRAAKRLTRHVRSANRLLATYPIRNVDELNSDDILLLAADLAAIGV